MIWLMLPMRPARWRFIRAERPCFKGEVQLGWLLIVWSVARPEGGQE